MELPVGNRDPRQDPHVGDVLSWPGDNLTWTVTGMEVIGMLVTYTAAYSDGQSNSDTWPIDMWRKQAQYLTIEKLGD